MRGIWAYTRGRWSEEQADKYWRQLTAAFEALAKRPNRGRPAAELRPNYLKYLVGSHIVFYVKADFGIDVVRILHERMDIPARLAESGDNVD